MVARPGGPQFLRDYIKDGPGTKDRRRSERRKVPDPAKRPVICSATVVISIRPNSEKMSKEK